MRASTEVAAHCSLRPPVLRRGARCVKLLWRRSCKRDALKLRANPFWQIILTTRRQVASWSGEFGVNCERKDLRSSSAVRDNIPTYIAVIWRSCWGGGACNAHDQQLLFGAFFQVFFQRNVIVRWARNLIASCPAYIIQRLCQWEFMIWSII